MANIPSVSLHHLRQDNIQGIKICKHQLEFNPKQPQKTSPNYLKLQAPSICASLLACGELKMFRIFQIKYFTVSLYFICFYLYCDMSQISHSFDTTPPTLIGLAVDQSTHFSGDVRVLNDINGRWLTQSYIRTVPFFCATNNYLK